MNKDSGLVELAKLVHSAAFPFKVDSEKLVFKTRRAEIQVNAFFNESYSFSACYKKSAAPDERCFEILDKIFRKSGEVSESGGHVFHNFTLGRTDLATIVDYVRMSDCILDAKRDYDAELKRYGSAVARMQ